MTRKSHAPGPSLDDMGDTTILTPYVGHANDIHARMNELIRPVQDGLHIEKKMSTSLWIVKGEEAVTAFSVSG